MNKKEIYWGEGINSVDGWLGTGILYPINIIEKIQLKYNITGGALEIGVYNGKFFIPLLFILSDNEFAVGIDIFEEQNKNIDFSGKGSYEKTIENIKIHYGSLDRIKLLKKDSISLNLKDKMDLLQNYGPFRLISIDGGHTYEHTLNDLLFVHDIIQGGGVIILDDYYNPEWPEVKEGLSKFIQLFPKFKIFCFTQNKLFITDITHYSCYFDEFKNNFCNNPNFKIVKMHGSLAVYW